jgi:tripartite-type tricarboxylate transporter receptor subunit TctC
MKSILLTALAGAASVIPAPSQAQSYPTKPIRFVISFGPGSASDVLSRILGQELMRTMGQPVVVLSKPGADGAISAQEVKHSPPDGYTYLFGSNSAYSVVPNLRKEPPYDVMKDFTPITYLGDNTYFILVHPSIPAKTINELIAYAKSNPDKLSYAAGNTYALVATAMFESINGIKMRPITYKSEPDAMPDLLSGRVQFMASTLTSAGPPGRDGKLRILATTLLERSPAMPEVPSYTEAGQAKFPIPPWFGMVGPAGMPAAIVARMNKEVVAALNQPAVKEAMMKQGFIAKGSTPEALAAHMKEQLDIWKTAIKLAGLEPQ